MVLLRGARSAVYPRYWMAEHSHLVDFPEALEVLFSRLGELKAVLGPVAAPGLDQMEARLREGLKLVVMSATLDTGAFARILGDAPVIESAGRAFPVETRYLGRDARVPIEQQVAQAVVRALRSEQGSLLVFLPGAAERPTVCELASRREC